MSVYDLHCTYRCFVSRYIDVYMRERVTVSKKIKENDYVSGKYVCKYPQISHREYRFSTLSTYTFSQYLIYLHMCL